MTDNILFPFLSVNKPADEDLIRDEVEDAEIEIGSDNEFFEREAERQEESLKERGKLARRKVENQPTE